MKRVDPIYDKYKKYLVKYVFSIIFALILAIFITWWVTIQSGSSIIPMFIIIPAWWSFVDMLIVNPLTRNHVKKKIIFILRKVFPYWWNIIVGTLLLIDIFSGYSITKTLMSFLSIMFYPSMIFLSMLPIIIVSGLKGLLARLLERVSITTLPYILEQYFISRPYGYNNLLALRKGMPILIKNKSKETVVISNIVIEINLSRAPIWYVKMISKGDLWSNEGLAYYHELIVEDHSYIVLNPNTSKILFIPWKKIAEICKYAFEMEKKIKSLASCFIMIYDEFSEREYRTPKINVRRLCNVLSSLSFSLLE